MTFLRWSPYAAAEKGDNHQIGGIWVAIISLCAEDRRDDRDVIGTHIPRSGDGRSPALPLVHHARPPRRAARRSPVCPLRSGRRDHPSHGDLGSRQPAPV